MSEEERIKMIKFCVSATAEIQGVDIAIVDESDFSVMDDFTLMREADWLDDLLSK